MRGRQEPVGAFDVRGQFLPDLSAQRLNLRFLRVTFPSREFPVPFEVDTNLTTGDEKGTVAFDDSGNDDESWLRQRVSPLFFPAQG